MDHLQSSNRVEIIGKVPGNLRVDHIRSVLRPTFSQILQRPSSNAGVRNVCIILHRMIFLMAPLGLDVFWSSASII